MGLDWSNFDWALGVRFNEVHSAFFFLQLMPEEGGENASVLYSSLQGLQEDEK